MDRPAREGPGEAFLFIGRLSFEKGVDTLLAAWEQLPDTELRLAGDGPLARAVRAAAEVGPVTALGFIGTEGVHRELMGARALVFTSRTHEMGPLAIVEAFAAGVPVIAPSFGVVPTVVDDGVTGILYRPRDPVSLASAVRWAAEHPEELEAMGRKARARYEERYTEQRAYATLSNVYDHVMGKARPG